MICGFPRSSVTPLKIRSSVNLIFSVIIFLKKVVKIRKESFLKYADTETFGFLSTKKGTIEITEICKIIYPLQTRASFLQK